MSTTDLENVEVSAAQVRAARALLAWSQQDLAKKASVGASTIADFERGQRTPVANNIAAIRKAMEDAGISFLTGGAVAHGAPAPPAARIAKGVPIRWVDGTDLTNWANRRSCQDTMPELISRLIRASMGPAARLRFPSGDSIQQSDWDGVCEIDEAISDLYIPQGISGWEIGTQRDKIKDKASSDYYKRSADPLDLQSSHSTFVFVTPRRWNKKREWVSERKRDGTWADVRALDADDLVHWIEIFPAVGAWLAAILAKRSIGIRQIDEAWREWACSTRWPLSENLVLAERDEQSAAVLRWLYGRPSVLAVRADSRMESAAFLYATLRQLPPEYQSYYYARTVIAATTDVARALSDSISPLLIVLEEADPGLSSLLAQRGHHVFLTAAETDSESTASIRLPRPLRESVRRSLLEIGINEDDAERLARDSGRNLAVLRRLIPAAPGTVVPKWAEPEHARTIMPALFVGAWDEVSESDRKSLERLSGETYEKWIASITQWTNSSDSPLTKEGTAWKVVSPKDAWLRLAPYASAVDLERFSALAIDVLSEVDPLYETGADERWIAPLRGHRPEHSALLRAGIAEALILISVFRDQIRNVTNSTFLPEAIVRRLLEDADSRRWWSLSGLLQNLAEAAPDAFLEAVDTSLLAEPSPVTALFKEDGGPFGRAYHSDLLWALEILAWSPHFLSRVTVILAKLTRQDPGGRFSNRPENSLRNIFLLWLPRTYASLDQRLRVIDYLRKTEPEVAWKLMMRTVPTGHDIAEPTSKPRWRDFSRDNEEIVTYGLIAKGISELSARLLEDAGLDGSRWSELIESFSNLSVEQREALVQKLSFTLDNLTDEATRLTIRNTVRRVLHQHRAYPDATWRLPEEQLLQLERIYNSLEPTDPIGKFGWLFSSKEIDPPRPTGKGWKEDEALVHKLRVDALREVLSIGGEDGLFQFAASVASTVHVGFSFIDLVGSSAREKAILLRCLNSETATASEIARGILCSILQRNGEDSADDLLKQAKDEAWSPQAITKIIFTLRPARSVWNWLERFGPEIESTYWSRVDLLWMNGTPEDRTFAATKLIDAKRARAAVHFMGRSPGDFSSSLLLLALDKAAAEPWPEDAGNERTMFIYSVEEILLCLDKANDVAEDRVAAVEWRLLPLLRNSRRPPVVLHRTLSKVPSFFGQVLSAAYRPDPESGITENSPADLAHTRAVAAQAYQLLQSWTVLPGKEDLTIKAAALEQWVKEARILCKDAGRLAVGDQHIGSVLAHAPADASGVWPDVPVRDLIEITRSKHLETGLVMGIHNSRGVTSRGMTDGGAQERDLAKIYRKWSRATELEWPRTSAVLERIAKSYEHEGQRHDEDAERNQW